ANVLAWKQHVDPRRPSELAAVPSDLDELCMALLRRRPEDRPSGPEVLSKLGNGASRERLERSPERATRFVGRVRAMQELGAALTAARDGAAVTLHVHGGSGMGKTALIERFLETVRADSRTTVLAGRCYERESVPWIGRIAPLESGGPLHGRGLGNGHGVLVRRHRELLHGPVPRPGAAADVAPR